METAKTSKKICDVSTPWNIYFFETFLLSVENQNVNKQGSHLLANGSKSVQMDNEFSMSCLAARAVYSESVLFSFAKRM